MNWNVIIVVSFFYVAILFNCVKCACKISINTKVGIIKGLIAKDGTYFKYTGIPYARIAPKNPFGLSIPYPLFEDVFLAYNDSQKCPQYNQETQKVEGTLDCLHLNVYLPVSVNTTARNLPVMIWIYGGRFEKGHAAEYTFGPSYLVQNGVILVTFNYRIGPYGFMCLDVPAVPGNQGLRDQYLAIKWVSDNIEAFGGDKNQITVFGQSAGGHSIDHHLMSSKKVLFNKVIIQSGSAQALTTLYDPDKFAAVKLARYTGFDTNDTKQALLYLSQVDPKLVISATKALKIHFRPCVENLFDNVRPFISKSWINDKVPQVKNMPVLIGFNELELAYQMFPKGSDYYKNLTIVLDYLIKAFHFTDHEFRAAEDVINDFYFGDEEMSEDLKVIVTQFSSDITYIHPLHRTLQKYIDNGAGNIYFYMFSYVGERNAVNNYTFERVDNSRVLCCASHSDELEYLFDMKNKPELLYPSEIIKDRMVAMWTNFAKYGDPTPTTSTLLPVKWIPVTPETYYYLNIGNELEVGRRPLNMRMAFWDLFFNMYKTFQKGFDDVEIQKCTGIKMVKMEPWPHPSLYTDRHRIYVQGTPPLNGHGDKSFS